jgi:hypothetical protein
VRETCVNAAGGSIEFSPEEGEEAILQTRSSTQSSASRLVSNYDLLPSERIFVGVMQQLGFGRFEFLRVENGELVLDPWPTTVRGVKFGSEDPVVSQTPPEESALKRQVIELFAYARSLEAGEIRCLEVRHGLPFSMEIEHWHDGNGGRPR